jgi:uncharacterized UPF0160 family protein
MTVTHSKIARSFGTHDGSFHADEVTACALLLLFDRIDRDKIIRTREMSQLSECEYVCDVGGVYDPALKLFDHHQQDYQGPLSSAGMILNYLFQTQLIDVKQRDFFEHSLIMGVDAHDNGKELHSKGVCTYSHIISNFNPIIYDSSPEEQDKAFFSALNFAVTHMSRMWERYVYTHSCQEVIAEAMKVGKDFLLFDKSIPWLEIFFEMEGVKHPATFVIMPSGHHWKLRGIPPSLEEKMKVRHPLPQEWAGLIGEDLKKVSGIEGAIFCHKGRFISVWETKEDALKALQQIILKKNRKR